MLAPPGEDQTPNRTSLGAGVGLSVDGADVGAAFGRRVGMGEGICDGTGETVGTAAGFHAVLSLESTDASELPPTTKRNGSILPETAPYRPLCIERPGSHIDVSTVYTKSAEVEG
jgi:hypothetical protein